MRDFGQLFDVLDVCAADVGVEKPWCSRSGIAFDEIVEVRADVLQRFGQTRLFLDGVHGEIDGGDSGVSQAVGYFRPQKGAR